RRKRIKVWRDKNNLAPGQGWKPEIAKAISEARWVIVCISAALAGREQSHVYDEVRQAMEISRTLPPGHTFVIPVRLEPYGTTDRFQFLNDFNFVDLYGPDGFDALAKLVKTLKS